MNPLGLLLAVWQAIARFVSDFFAPPELEPAVPRTVRSRERRERNAQRRQLRELRGRHPHGRQTRPGPRARRRRQGTLACRAAGRDVCGSAGAEVSGRDRRPVRIGVPARYRQGFPPGQPAGNALEVRENRLRGDWEVLREGGVRPLLFRESREEAVRAAHDRLAERGFGGEILVLNHTGKVAERVWVESSVEEPFNREMGFTAA